MGGRASDYPSQVQPSSYGLQINKKKNYLILHLSRQGHSSVVTPRGLLLVGGSSSPTTTELLVEGEHSVDSFSLIPGRENHCSIQVRSITFLSSQFFYQLGGAKLSLRISNCSFKTNLLHNI